jgi:hypothetical protein
VRGLDVANQTLASGAGRKMFLTCPLIDQAIALRIQVRPRAEVAPCETEGMSPAVLLRTVRWSETIHYIVNQLGKMSCAMLIAEVQVIELRSVLCSR